VAKRARQTEVALWASADVADEPASLFAWEALTARRGGGRDEDLPP
jgi:hypothetical protein